MSQVPSRSRGNRSRLLWKHQGSTSPLASWSENDAQMFRAELQHALRAIAAQAIDELAPDPVQTPAAEPKG